MEGKQDILEPLRRLWLFPPVKIAVFGLLSGLPVMVLWPVIVGFAHGGTDGFLLGLAAVAVLAPSTIVALWIMARFVDRRPFASTGITPHGMFLETGLGVAIGFALISLTVSVLSAAGYYNVTGRQSDFQYGPVIAYYLGIAICEEVIYRGYVLQSLEKRWGTTVAVFATCVLFGIEHIGNVDHESALHMVKVVLFLGFGAGGLFAMAYLMTRRLWLSIGLHWAWNFFLGAFYGLPVSGSNLTDSYLQATLKGPRYLTGEKFGPECSLITIGIAWIIAFAFFVRTLRNRNWRLHPSVESYQTDQNGGGAIKLADSHTVNPNVGD